MPQTWKRLWAMSLMGLVLAVGCDAASGDGTDVGSSADTGGYPPLADTTSGGPDTILGPDVMSPGDVAGTPDQAGTDATAPEDVAAAPDVATPRDVATRPETVDPQCAALQPGTNSGFMVDGTARTFILHVPTDAETAGPWPVVFNWHGFGDSASNMAQLLSGAVNGSYPFLLVTPDDLNLQPPSGMDWDVLSVAQGSQEVRLFDEVLECLDQRYGVDWDRIHTVGFSAGAIASDLLGVMRGDQLASVVSFSGAYFANPDTHAQLGMLGSYVTWPAMSGTNPYAQLIAYGGTGDNYSLYVTTLQFDEAASTDSDFLAGRGHDLVICNHESGHTIPGAFMSGQITTFLADHPRSTSSPYLTDGLPANFPAYCSTRAGE